MVSIKNIRKTLGMRVLIALLAFAISLSFMEQVVDLFSENAKIETSKKSAEKKGENFEKELENEAEKDHFLTFNISEKINSDNFQNAQNVFLRSKIEFFEIVSPPPESLS